MNQTIAVFVSLSSAEQLLAIFVKMIDYAVYRFHNNTPETRHRQTEAGCWKNMFNHTVSNNATYICNQMSQRKFILNMFIKHTLTHNVQIFVITYKHVSVTAVSWCEDD